MTAPSTGDDDLSDGWQIAAIEAATERISELARAGGLAEPIAHLNRWRVRDVVAHLGGVQRWAVRILHERSMAGPGFVKSKLDGSELCDWFDAGAALLTETFRSTDLSEPCPNFNPGSDRTVAWWARRQAHEATVHRWDIEKALACTTEIAKHVAADGIDEFLDVFVRTRGKQTLTSTLVLNTTQPKRTWTLTPAQKPGRIDVAVGPNHVASTALTEVSGTPEGVLLALWGRHSATEASLTITGDPSAAAALVTL